MEQSRTLFALLLFFTFEFDKITKIYLGRGEAISIVRDIWEGFDFSYLLSILLSVVPSLICITLHELGHGFVACFAWCAHLNLLHQRFATYHR